MPSQSHVLTDHDEIRRWAEQRKAAPACVRGTGGKNDIGVLRLDFPGYSGEQSLQRIDWDEWLDKFDERGLALLVQDRTARGQRSNFNKLVSRDTARKSASRVGGGSRSKSTGARARKTTRRSSTAAKQTSRSAASGRSRSTRSTKRAAAKSSRSGASAKRKSASSRSRSTPGKRSSSSRRSATAKASNTTRARRASASRSASTASNSARSRRGTATSSSRRSGTSSRRNATSSRGRSASSHVMVDRDEIRRWAEDRNAEPACVRGTGGGDDPGMIRLDFPGYTGADSLERIDWEDWFRAFDENNLALVVQDRTSSGEPSNFNKLVSRENAMRGSNRGKKSGGATSRTRASKGNSGTLKQVRGSTRAHRTESVRGRTTSQRRAA